MNTPLDDPGYRWPIGRYSGTRLRIIDGDFLRLVVADWARMKGDKVLVERARIELARRNGEQRPCRA